MIATTATETSPANNNATAASGASARAQAHAEYINDQLQQERTVSDHAAMLRTRASTRMAAMAHARVAAGKTDAETDGVRLDNLERQMKLVRTIADTHREMTSPALVQMLGALTEKALPPALPPPVSNLRGK